MANFYFFYNLSQFICAIINFWIYSISYKFSKQIKHRMMTGIQNGTRTQMPSSSKPRSHLPVGQVFNSMLQTIRMSSACIYPNPFMKEISPTINHERNGCYFFYNQLRKIGDSIWDVVEMGVFLHS